MTATTRRFTTTQGIILALAICSLFWVAVGALVWAVVA